MEEKYKIINFCLASASDICNDLKGDIRKKTNNINTLKTAVDMIEQFTRIAKMASEIK